MNKAHWIAATLLNDEAASDKEMVAYFMKEGKMRQAEAEFYVKQRNRALLECLEFRLQPFCSHKGVTAHKSGGEGAIC